MGADIKFLPFKILTHSGILISSSTRYDKDFFLKQKNQISALVEG